ARDYPRQYDHDYVLGAILADAGNLGEEQRPHVRYFSLHNAVVDADPTFSLAGKRQALFRAIAELSKKDAPAPTAADPAGVVFRVELRQSGWGLQPFERRRLDGMKMEVREPSKVNLFDLILLEYPFGHLEPDSATFKQVSEQFLKPADQAVPIAYLRADWFVDEFSQSPVAAEFIDVLELPKPAKRDPQFTIPLPREPKGKGISI